MAGLSAECAAELQGVRGKMLRMRAEVDAATDKADKLSKDLQQCQQILHQTEEERNALQRQCTNLNDQLFSLDDQLKLANDRLADADSNRETLYTEVKGLNHRLNVSDEAEENYKQQLTAERDRAAQLDIESSEYKRNVARLQMDNEKLDHDVNMLRGQNMNMVQQLKEAEDRIAELTSSYNQLVIENRQMDSHRHGHRHETRSIHQAPPAEPQTIYVSANQAALGVQQNDQELKMKDKQLQERSKDLEEVSALLAKREAKIHKLENEVFVYQENHKLLTDQLQEIQRVNNELKTQMNRLASAGDQLIDTRETNKSLNDQLEQSEKRNSTLEAKIDDMGAHIGRLEQQLLEQKAAYGELYSQMNKTLEDMGAAEEDGVCDF